MTPSSWIYARPKRFRAGVEAGISYLKRRFGPGRCRWRGLPRFKSETDSRRTFVAGRVHHQIPHSRGFPKLMRGDRSYGGNSWQFRYFANEFFEHLGLGGDRLPVSVCKFIRGVKKIELQGIDMKTVCPE